MTVLMCQLFLGSIWGQRYDVSWFSVFNTCAQVARRCYLQFMPQMERYTCTCVTIWCTSAPYVMCWLFCPLDCNITPREACNIVFLTYFLCHPLGLKNAPEGHFWSDKECQLESDASHTSQGMYGTMFDPICRCRPYTSPSPGLHRTPDQGFQM